MRKLKLLLVLFVLFSCMTQTCSAQTANLAKYDEDAAETRRVVREYCAIVQEMMTEKFADPQKQKNGLSLLHQAQNSWNKFMIKWADKRPLEYAADKSYKARLQDFKNALEDMEKTLATGDARRSFNACGYGCGIFVTMHEQNGLKYALDTLFHLRKAAKTIGAVMKSKRVDKVRELLNNTMTLRDKVLTAPAPWQGDDERIMPYYEAVRQVSRQLDEMVLAINADNIEAAVEPHKMMLTEINKAYGLAL
ncbi:MAG: hypothetical protein EOM80_17875 [Erysipelotrichia bacterium]|nr:hypothetical protein [Erysipelotrichia bacterium]